jgi:hypothetical protein
MRHSWAVVAKRTAPAAAITAPTPPMVSRAPAR